MRRGDVDDETDKTKQDRPQATSQLASHCTLCSRKLDARWTISKLSSDRTNRLSVHLTSPWSPLSGLSGHQGRSFQAVTELAERRAVLKRNSQNEKRVTFTSNYLTLSRELFMQSVICANQVFNRMYILMC
jgi:hypothetical protein